MGIKAGVLCGISELEIHAVHMFTTTPPNTCTHTRVHCANFYEQFESKAEKLQMISTTQTPVTMTTELQ